MPVDLCLMSDEETEIAWIDSADCVPRVGERITLQVGYGGEAKYTDYKVKDVIYQMCSTSRSTVRQVHVIVRTV